MADKVKKEGSGFKGMLVDIFSNSLVGLVANKVDDLMISAQHKLEQTERDLMRRMIAMSIFLAGGIFISVSAVFFLIEVQGLSKYVSFLIGGLCLIIIGFLYNTIIVNNDEVR